MKEDFKTFPMRRLANQISNSSVDMAGLRLT
jgi:hypothetical protein